MFSREEGNANDATHPPTNPTSSPAKGLAHPEGRAGAERDAFVPAPEVGGTSSYHVTDRGKRIAESPKGEELTIEEIV